MVSRLALAAAVLLSFGLIGEVQADTTRQGYYVKKRGYSSRRVYRSYRRPAGVGGQSAGQQYTPYVYFNGQAPLGPYYDNRTFWDRVQGSPDFNVR